MALPPSPFPKPRPPRQFGVQQGSSRSDEPRINHRIRVPEVRLIDEKGNQVGIVRTEEALRMAKERGLDLLEISPTAKPPVCKILDYGKFKYEKKKKDHEAKKKQTQAKVKEIQLSPNIDQHDLEYKSKNIRAFLENGDKAKVTIFFKGRQMAHTDLGMKVFDKVRQNLADIGTVESEPKIDGRKLIMVLVPVPKKPAQK